MVIASLPAIFLEQNTTLLAILDLESTHTATVFRAQLSMTLMISRLVLW